MRNFLFGMAVITMLFSCNDKKTLDLCNVDFGKDSKDYRLSNLSPSKTTEQNGHYEVEYSQPLNESTIAASNGNVFLVIKDDGEEVISYLFDDEKSNAHINYAGLPLDASYGTKIVDYNGKISFISTSIDRLRTGDLISILETKMGKPTEVISNETMAENLTFENITSLLRIFPQDTKKMKNEWGNDVVSYPERLVWSEANRIYLLTLNPLGEGITNTLIIISKKAFKDKVILGFHVPDKDPILSSYLK